MGTSVVFPNILIFTLINYISHTCSTDARKCCVWTKNISPENIFVLHFMTLIQNTCTAYEQDCQFPEAFRMYNAIFNNVDCQDINVLVFGLASLYLCYIDGNLLISADLCMTATLSDRIYLDRSL